MDKQETYLSGAREALDDFFRFAGQPIYLSARPALLLLVIPLLLSFTVPLWRIEMVAPQYPKGLQLEIYAYKLVGGNEGRDIAEINTLNHYIGMRQISREALSDLDWLPFAFGILALLALRVAALGTVRGLIDLCVISIYVGAFGLGRFYYALYSFGHDLDPKAPFKVEPFTPVMFGEKQVANFTTAAYPQSGSYLVAVFVVGLLFVLCWHLIGGWRSRANPDRG